MKEGRKIVRVGARVHATREVEVYGTELRVWKIKRWGLDVYACKTINGTDLKSWTGGGVEIVSNVLLVLGLISSDRLAPDDPDPHTSLAPRGGVTWLRKTHHPKERPFGGGH